MEVLTNEDRKKARVMTDGALLIAKPRGTSTIAGDNKTPFVPQFSGDAPLPKSRPANAWTDALKQAGQPLAPPAPVPTTNTDLTSEELGEMKSIVKPEVAALPKGQAKGSGERYGIDRSGKIPVLTGIGPTLTTEQREEMRAKEEARDSVWRKEQQSLKLDDQLGALRKQAADLSTPHTMAPLDLYHQGFVGEANLSNPSYRNAMLEKRKWEKEGEGKASQLKSVQDQIASLTGERRGDMADDTTRRGQDETSAWRKQQSTDARLAREAAESEGKLNREEKKADRLAEVKYKADSDRKARALTSATNKTTGIVDEDLYARLVDADEKMALGWKKKETRGALPKRSEGGFLGMGSTKLPAEPALYEWEPPAGNADKLALSHYTPEEIAAYKKSKGI